MRDNFWTIVSYEAGHIHLDILCFWCDEKVLLDLKQKLSIHKTLLWDWNIGGGQWNSVLEAQWTGLMLDWKLQLVRKSFLSNENNFTKTNNNNFFSKEEKIITISISTRIWLSYLGICKRKYIFMFSWWKVKKLEAVKFIVINFILFFLNILF